MRSHRKAREQRIRFIREQWRVLLWALSITIVTFAVTIYVEWRIVGERFALLLLGASAVVVVWMMWELLEMDGSERLRHAGRGEEWTSEVFRKLAGWHVIDHIEFDGFDVDHVAVGQGGVLALETKVTNVPWKVTANGLQGPYGDPVRQARDNARKIRLLLKSEQIDVPVVPALVLWGRGVPALEHGHAVLEGVLVLIGRQSDEWRADLQQPQIEDGLIEAARETLQRFVEKRDAHIAAQR